MNTQLEPTISRRRLLRSTSLAATVGLLAPRHLLAQDDGLVQTARKTAAASTFTVQKLRGNVSVLMGAGEILPFIPVATVSSSSTPALPVRGQRSSTRLHRLAPIPSSTSSTRTGTSTTPTATNGCTPLVQRSLLTRTQGSISPQTRESRVGILLSKRHQRERFQRKSSKRSRPCNLMARRSFSNTTRPLTPTVTSPFILRTRIFSTSPTRSGMATIRSSITQPAGA